MTDTASPAAVLAPNAPFAGPSLNPRRLVAFVCMIFGMFMAILDIQIVSASLAEIQVGLSASADEVAWVQTSYLVAEVVMIPLSGFLSRALSTRHMFAISAAGFTLMSLMCATAASIDQMIVWRVCQGFIGGAMIPIVFGAAYTAFPVSTRPVIVPIVGLVATLAPTIGPTVGGYLTDLFSWRWLFLVNVGPGIVVAVVTWLLIDFDEPQFSLLANFDWIGLVSMAVFLGALEYCLEEGPGKNWFEERIISWAALASTIAGVIFFGRISTTNNPIVDLKPFRDRNFWSGSLLSFVMGVGLYGLTYIYPIYLSRVRGYSALQIGTTLFVSGLCMFLTAPIAGRLMQRVDGRYVIGVGFLCFAAGTLQASAITRDWEFYEILAPQILRGVSLMLCMVQINNLALGTLHADEMKNASGVFNLTRNLGGAVGLALINTLLNQRTDLHLARLRELVTWSNESANALFAQMTGVYMSRGSDAALAATKAISHMVRREALVMSIADVFLALTALFTVMATFTLVMKRPASQISEDSVH